MLKKKLYNLIILINLQYNENVNVFSWEWWKMSNRIKNCFYNRMIRTNLISNEDHQTEIKKEKFSQHVYSRNNAKSNYHAFRVTAIISFSLCVSKYVSRASIKPPTWIIFATTRTLRYLAFSANEFPLPPLFPFKFYDRECNRCANRWSDNSQLRMHDRQSTKENRLYRSRIIGYHYNSALTRSRSRAAFIKKY